MRFKKNPTRLPFSDELLVQKSISEQIGVIPKLNGVHSSSTIIKKSKVTVVSSIKQQKRLKLQKYRDKLLADPKKENLEEDDECLIDFLRKYNEYQEKQNPQAHSTSTYESESSYSHSKKSPKKTKLTKLQRAMKDLECTLVQGNTLPTVSNPFKNKRFEAARREILKSKKMNQLRNYRLQKQSDELEALQDVDMEMSSGLDRQSAAGSLDSFKQKLIHAVIEKDEMEDDLCLNKNSSQLENKEEDTPISVLIKSNEMQMMKTNGLDGEGGGVNNVPAEVEEEIVDEAIKKKIEKLLHIDVTDKYNFVKQTARTKLRPKCTPDVDLNRRFRKNRYRATKNVKAKKTNSHSELASSQNRFLGFDKSIKRFKDEKRVSSACEKTLVNRSYFNLDSFTVPTHVRTVDTPECHTLTAVGFEDELDFLQYSLVYKKSQSTLDARLRQRLELWMRMCKTRKDLQTKLSKKSFHFVENETNSELNCDRASELLGCDREEVMFAVPTTSCPYLEVKEDCMDLWRCQLNQDKDQRTKDASCFKSEMRKYIKRMILEKQIRCNSTYAAYDISKQDATNLYEDERVIEDEVDHVEILADNSPSSGKTSRISYYTRDSHVNVSVNLTPVKRRPSDLDSENVSLASSCDPLPQAHIAKIEEMFSDSNDASDAPEIVDLTDDSFVEMLDEVDTKPFSSEAGSRVKYVNVSDTSDAPDIVDLSDDSVVEINDGLETQANTTRVNRARFVANVSDLRDNVEPNSSEGSNAGSYADHLGNDFLVSNKAEHNGMISSFLDYGNGQNTKRKRATGKQKMLARRAKQRNDRRSQTFDGDNADAAQTAKRSDTSLDLSNESNSNSYESMYDIVKTKNRHSFPKSIFNFENCKFPRKDGDVFYTSLVLNNRAVPVLAMYQKTKHLPRDKNWSIGDKCALKLSKFTNLKIFIICVKNFCFVIFKN